VKSAKEKSAVIRVFALANPSHLRVKTRSGASSKTLKPSKTDQIPKFTLLKFINPQKAHPVNFNISMR